MTKRRFLTTRRVLLTAVLLPGLAWATGCGAVEAQEAETGAPSEAPIVGVETAPLVAATGYDLARDYTGELRAARRQTLGFEVAGRVQAVLVQEGQAVLAGEPVAVLDGERLQVRRAELAAQIEGARASLEEAIAGPRPEVIDASRARVTAYESDLDLAEKRLVRRRELLAGNAASAEDVDAAAAGVDTLRATLAGARAQLAELESGTRSEQLTAARSNVDGLEASLRRIDVDLGDLTLRAPFAGTIAARHVNEGAMVNVGQSAVELLESQVLEAWIGVPPEELEALQANQPELIVRGAVRQWQGLSILPELDLASRTVTAVLNLDSASAGDLRPGELARIRIVRTSEEPGYWVPTLALTQGIRGLWSLFLLDAEAGQETGLVQRADVEVLHVDGARSFVRGTLQDGDRIVVSGAHRIAPGQRVRSQPQEQQ